MKTLKLCADCRHHRVVAVHILVCSQPKINQKNPVYLSSTTGFGLRLCSRERQGGFFSLCGWRGRLWEPQAGTGAPSPLDGDTRECTCHPNDKPPYPCPRKFALTECLAAAACRDARPK